MKIFELEQNGNIIQRGTYLAPNGLAHNVHVMGQYLFIAHYSSGVVVVDWSDPDNLVQVASYDTHPQNETGGFHGCWGTFPFTANGYVYASDFDGKLTILEWDPLGVATDEPQREDHRVWPNPMSAFTNIGFSLDAAKAVRIRVLDTQGRQVALLRDEVMGAGNYTQPWTPSADIVSGVYFIEVTTGQHAKVHKVLLQR